MVEGHVTDPASVEKIRIYLNSDHIDRQPCGCPAHGDQIRIVDSNDGKIVITGCCKAFILEQLDQISRAADWLEFYNSINIAE